MNPLDGIPSALASEVQQIWAAEVADGRALYLKTGSVAGRTGCRKISRLLRQSGINPDRDGRWERVIEEGRRLYFGKPTP